MSRSFSVTGMRSEFEDTMDVGRARTAELAARARLNRLQQSFVRSSVQSARTQLEEHNRQKANAVKTETSTLFGRHLAKQFASVAAARPKEVVEMSVRMNAALVKCARPALATVPPQAIGRGPWHRPPARDRRAFPDDHSGMCFKLFKQLDIDNSGMLSYAEYSHMVRNLLKMSARDLEETEMQAPRLAEPLNRSSCTA